MKSKVTKTILVAWALTLALASACSPQAATNAPAADANVAGASAAATPTPAPANTPAAEARGKPDNRAGGRPNELFTRMGFDVGAVTNVSANSLTIKARSGDQTVQLATNALIVIPDKTNATASDLKRGDRVLIHNGENKDASANFAMVLPANFSLDSQALGQIESVSANSITLKSKSGSQTITLDAATQYAKFTPTGVMLGAVSDLQNAAGVIVIKDSSAADAKAIAVIALGKAGQAPNAQRDGKGPKPGK